MSSFSFKCSVIRIIRINLALSCYANEASATYLQHPAGTMLSAKMRTLLLYLSIYTLWLKSNNSKNRQGSSFNLCNVWWRMETTSAHSAYNFFHSVWELICIFIFLQTCGVFPPTLAITLSIHLLLPFSPK